MQKLINVIATGIFFVIPICSLANQVPRSLATDNRMKVVSYNPQDVVTINGNHLVETAIQFNPNESITGVYIGDQIAWTYAINKAQPSVLFIKPTLDTSDTNMTVMTNKNVYQFHLMTKSSDSPSSSNVTYSVTFKYPEEEQKKIELQLAAQRAIVSTKPVNPASWNWNYSFTGSKENAPIHAFDDGKFTYFEFKDNTDTPAIFLVDANRNESVVNYRV